MEAFFARGRDVFLRARHAISGKEGVRVQVDVEGHRREASLHRAKWKASVSRNGPWSAKRWGAGNRRSCCVKGASRRDAKDLASGTPSSFCFRRSFTSKSKRCG